MKYRRYTAPEVVEQTREAIHLFIRKQIDPFVALLDENFVWIGIMSRFICVEFRPFWKV